MSENIKPFGSVSGWYDGKPIIHMHEADYAAGYEMPLFDQSAIVQARQEGRDALLAELREKGTIVEANREQENADLRRQLAAAQAREAERTKFMRSFYCGDVNWSSLRERLADWVRPADNSALERVIAEAVATAIDPLIAVLEAELRDADLYINKLEAHRHE